MELIRCSNLTMILSVITTIVSDKEIFKIFEIIHTPQYTCTYTTIHATMQEYLSRKTY